MQEGQGRLIATDLTETVILIGLGEIKESRIVMVEIGTRTCLIEMKNEGMIQILMKITMQSPSILETMVSKQEIQ
ncbi:hypothetical protein DPMN_186693 [Dreissena polymorpha]|uniref:Uncharacterized protein n=1 Tax=Dreissena polymorpha TaxID=45954 RepID=A0A9D4DN23_DREPO|nr:hypothetical protein DPMN_186693 [Dreissena polymorpha]